MRVLQTRQFKQAVKKLHKNQKRDLDNAIKTIMESPDIGTAKVGDLLGVSVYKTPIAKQLTLIAYSHTDSPETLTLLALGSHENFYRDLK